jgi:antitoxin ParD1/3/4
MNNSLTPEFQEFVAQEIASGRYGSEIDVIQEGLRLLRERESEQSILKELRREIAIGIEEADNGKTGPLNAQDTLTRVRQNREQLAQKQP